MCFPVTFRQMEPRTTTEGILILWMFSGVGEVGRGLLFSFDLDCGFELLLLAVFNIELVFAFRTILS